MSTMASSPFSLISLRARSWRSCPLLPRNGNSFTLPRLQAREGRRQGRVVRLPCCPRCQEGMSHGDSRRCTAHFEEPPSRDHQASDWKTRVRLLRGRWQERASLEQAVCPRVCLEISVSSQVCTPCSDPASWQLNDAAFQHLGQTGFDTQPVAVLTAVCILLTRP